MTVYNLEWGDAQLVVAARARVAAATIVARAEEALHSGEETEAEALAQQAKQLQEFAQEQQALGEELAAMRGMPGTTVFWMGRFSGVG